MAGEQDWQSSLAHVIDIAVGLLGDFVSAGGSSRPAGPSGAAWSPQRQFLMDQAVCIEVICECRLKDMGWWALC
jgi:hypothetical protein